MKNKPLMILVFLAALLMPQYAFAAEAALPIRAGIVQCGVRAELPQACSRDERCCAFLHLAPATEELSESAAPQTPPEEGIRMSQVAHTE